MKRTPPFTDPGGGVPVFPKCCIPNTWDEIHGISANLMVYFTSKRGVVMRLRSQCIGAEARLEPRPFTPVREPHGPAPQPLASLLANLPPAPVGCILLSQDPSALRSVFLGTLSHFAWGRLALCPNWPPCPQSPQLTPGMIRVHFWRRPWS